MKRGIWVGDLGCLTEGSCLGFQSTMEGCYCVSPVAMYASAATLTNRRICMQLEGMSYNSRQSMVGAGGGREQQDSIIHILDRTRGLQSIPLQRCSGAGLLLREQDRVDCDAVPWSRGQW